MMKRSSFDRRLGLTHIHQVVIHSFNSDHLHEVILIVSLVCRLRAVCVVFEDVVKKLRWIKNEKSFRYKQKKRRQKEMQFSTDPYIFC